MTNEAKTAGQRAMEFINSAIESGKTVYVCTYTRATKVTPKTVASWNKSGLKLFKLVDGDLFMASGRSWNRLTSGEMSLVGFKAA